jgi:hypothetical protein
MWGSQYRNSGVRCYDSAMRYFQSIKPWRGQTGEHDERPLRERSRHKGVRKLHDGSIVFRLHNTDVVTYRPDGSAVISVYQSPTTQTFVDCFGPKSMAYVNVNSGYATFRGRHYRITHGAVLTLTADKIDGTSPWVLPRIDRAMANNMRRLTGLDKVKLWVKAADALGAPLSEERVYYSRYEVPDLIADQSKWNLFRSRAQNALKDYEQHMLRTHCVVHDKPVESYGEYNSMLSYWRAMRAWG